jgi:aryl-alcohol dehydrogenase-like predicted oxidoreductase
MQYNLLGNTGLNVSRLSFGASSLSAVFHSVNENDAIRSVHAALNAGINYFDVAPAYGGTESESVLGKALKGISRSRYILSTKVGKYTAIDKYGTDVFDYSADRIYRSIEESASRLGVDYFDIIHIHDIEYQHRKYTEWALTEGLDTVHQLKREGRAGAVSFGIYPLDLWQRIMESYAIDAALVHNHYCLNDTGLTALLPVAREKGIGIINASPFGSGLLTDRGPAEWHPADNEDRAVFQEVAAVCRAHNTSIAKLAIQFSSQHPEIPTTMFSSSNPESVVRNILWSEEPLDSELLFKVQEVLAPVMNKQWDYR